MKRSHMTLAIAMLLIGTNATPLYAEEPARGPAGLAAAGHSTARTERDTPARPQAISGTAQSSRTQLTQPIATKVSAISQRACRDASFGCAAGIGTGIGIACLGAIYVSGGNPYVSGAGCALGIGDAWLSCDNVKSTCEPTVFASSGWESNWTGGSIKDTAVLAQCDGEAMVEEMKIYGKLIGGNYMITKITIVCTDNAQYSIGRNEGYESKQIVCNPARAISGFETVVRNAKNDINKFTTYCRGFDYEGTEDLAGFYGATPSVPSPSYLNTVRVTCPNHSWMNGIAARRTNGPLITDEYFTGFKLNCL